MRIKRLVLAGIFMLFVIMIASPLFAEPASFELDTLFLKVAINENGTAINDIKIKNTGQTQEKFSFKINGLENLASIEEREITLAPNEEHTTKIIFKGNAPAGAYLGELEIASKKIPIVLEIESRDVLFDSNINLFPRDGIVPGKILNAEIKIFDLANIGTSNVNLAYSIEDFSGKTIVSETENIVVDNRLSLTKTINLPTDLSLENYVLVVVVEYDGSIGTSSVFFRVIEEAIEAEEELFSGKNMGWFFVLVFGFFFLGFAALFAYSLFYRDKALKELQNQYRGELKRQRELIKERGGRDYAKLKTTPEKKEYKKELKKVKEQRLKTLKEMQKKKLAEFRKIKETGRTSDLKKHLEKWQVQGYDTSTLEKKYKLPDINEIRKKLGRQLGALEKAREEGYISKKSYKKGRERINRAKRRAK